MLVVMHGHSTAAQIDRVLDAIRQMGLVPHPMPGPTRTAIGITGNTSSIDARTLEVLPGVVELIRVTKPYKLASREMHRDDTVIALPQATVGPGTFTVVAGPCSVENEAMVPRRLRQTRRHKSRRRAPVRATEPIEPRPASASLLAKTDYGQTIHR